MPDPKHMAGAIVKLTVEYPRELDVFIDETALRKYAEHCFEFHLVKKPKVEARVRIPQGQAISSLSPLDLLTQYFDSAKINEAEDLRELAQQIIYEDDPDI
jgi:exonuclease SbcD